MTEQQKTILEDSLNSLIDGIDRKYLRKMQVQMHNCAINCTQRDDYNYMKVNQCIENCSVPVKNAQQILHQQIENFHNRLLRCLQQCKDDVQDKVSGQLTSSQMSYYERELHDCSRECLVKMTESVPNLANKMAAAMEQNFTV